MPRMVAMAVSWVKLELELANFRANSVSIPVLPASMEVTTLADLGDTPHNRRRLYDLNKSCSADIPGRGDFFTYEEYVERRFETASFRPDGQIVLMNRTDMAGMCAVSYCPGKAWAFIEMTGALPGYRRRGLATLLKVHALAAARRWGAQTVRTIHHPANRPIIGANRKLGFTDAAFDLS